jgi:hypothetical protein
MWLALAIVSLSVLGALLCWALVSHPPGPELADPEQADRLRHERARQEISVIEAATRRLMRTVAAAEGGIAQGTALAVRPGPGAVPARRTTFRYVTLDGFAWALDSQASNSTSPGRVTMRVLPRGMH